MEETAKIIDDVFTNEAAQEAVKEAVVQNPDSGVILVVAGIAFGAGVLVSQVPKGIKLITKGCKKLFGKKNEAETEPEKVEDVDVVDAKDVEAEKAKEA